MLNAEYIKVQKARQLMFTKRTMKLLINLSLLIVALATAAGAQWTQIPGGLTQVSANINYIWGVNSADQIFICPRPCDGKGWKQINGALKQLDVDDHEVWGVNARREIYKRPVDGSGEWQRIPGGLKHVSASGHGYVWGVDNADKIYKCQKPCSGKWIEVGGRLKQVDGGQREVYGVNAGNAIYARGIDGSGAWRSIRGSLKYITASGVDTVFGITPKDELVRCIKPCLGDFEIMSGELSQCDATVNALFGVSSGCNTCVFRHDLPLR